jgi:hypothetical protein
MSRRGTEMMGLTRCDINRCSSSSEVHHRRRWNGDFDDALRMREAALDEDEVVDLDGSLVDQLGRDGERGRGCNGLVGRGELVGCDRHSSKVLQEAATAT